jgi:hypothetical protein
MSDTRLDAALQKIEEAQALLEDWGPPAGTYLDKVYLWRQAVMHVGEAHWYLQRASEWHVPR